MELRDIEIFLTLAEELDFRRTAQRLHVSQARISQAIKAQERRIGAALFDRTSRAVKLTALVRTFGLLRGSIDASPRNEVAPTGPTRRRRWAGAAARA